MKHDFSVVHIPRRFVPSEWGGSETFIVETVKRMMKKGFPARIVTTLALSGQREELFEGIPVRRHPYFYPYLGLSRGARAMLDRKAGNLFSFSLMRDLARGPAPDLLHLHTGKRLGGIVRRYAVRHNIPYVISLHGGRLSVPRNEQESWTEPTRGAWEWGKLLGWWVGSRRVLDDAAAVICVGRDEYEAVAQAYPGKEVVYLPNGVDVARFAAGDGAGFRSRYGIPPDRFLCLTTARFDGQKNQLALVRQLKRISTAEARIHLLLIGAVTSPEYLEAVRREAEQAGTADRLTIITGIPYTDQTLVDAYHAADCFVLPSLHEPFGMVVLEAWAAGLPAAVSRRGGLPAIVTHEQDGLLFDPEAEEGSPDSIASAVVRLAGDSGLRTRLGSAGRQTAAGRYSWDAVTDQLLELYRRIDARTLS